MPSEKNVLDFDREEDLGLSSSSSPVVKEVVDDVLKARGVFVKDGADVFARLQKHFKFQGDNERNSREAATLLVASRMASRNQTATQALQQLRDDLLRNYHKWAVHVGLDRGGRNKARSEKKEEDAAAQVALVHLIWGEAANLRFCPEFLALVFRDFWRRWESSAANARDGCDLVASPYLLKVIKPAYERLSKFASEKGDHVDRVNYCDFNEAFHNAKTVKRILNELERGESYKRVVEQHGFEKTYLETRSYFHVFRSQFRLISFHCVALHALVVVAYGEAFHHVAVTLAATLVAREIVDALILGVPYPKTCSGWGMLLTHRLAFLVVFAACFEYVAARYALLVLVALSQLLPKRQPGFFKITDNSLKIPSAILWIVAVSFKLYTSYFLSVKPLVNMTQRLTRNSDAVDDDAFRWYLIEWQVGGVRVDTIGVTDANRVTLIVGAWLPHLVFFFLDLEVWYVFLSNMVSAVIGIARGIGSDRGSGRILRTAKFMPSALLTADAVPTRTGGGTPTRQKYRAGFSRMESARSDDATDAMVYPDYDDDDNGGDEEKKIEMRVVTEAQLDPRADASLRRHIWFGAAWNEMCRTMREQDLVSDAELESLLYSMTADAKSDGRGTCVLENIKEPDVFEAIKTPDAQPEALVKSSEVWRRLRFFVNSLRPIAKAKGFPSVLNTIQTSTLVPYYDEPVVYEMNDLQMPTSGGVTVLELLETIAPNEFDNLLERCKKNTSSSKEGEGERRFLAAGKVVSTRSISLPTQAGQDEVPSVEIERWAAFRGQTLLRTAQGLSFYDRALRLMAKLSDGLSSSSSVTNEQASQLLESDMKQQGDVFSVLSKLKYTLVLSCQIYGDMKKAPAGSARAKQAVQIENLMQEFTNVRVAYVDKRLDSDNNPVFSSVLVKWDSVSGRVVEVYRVALPGNFMIGEAKPCNQNHAIIFTRGEAVQAIDMNQAGYFEEALKLPFFFRQSFSQSGPPRIAGHREHVFTNDVSSLASFMSVQESLFVTATQRVLDKPLGVRFHYGHPDFFHRPSAMTCGGVSKASKGINLSEDIFGGFNFVLRGGKSTQSDVVQVGKGKDVGFAQITTFQAKIAMGNAEQTLSRDVMRLGTQSSLVQHFSIFYSSTGHFLLQVGIVAVIFLGAYAKLFIAVRGIQKAVDDSEDRTLTDLVYDTVFANQMLGLYLLILVGSVVSNAVEVGLGNATVQFLEKMLLRGGVLFYAFQVATKSSAFHTTIVYGKATYQGTGRGFDIKRADMTSIFTRFYSSHFVLGVELALALAIFFAGSNYNAKDFVQNEFIACFFVVSLLFTPFLFNPDGFDYLSAVKDLGTWSIWMGARSQKNSWEHWWTESEKKLVSRPFSTKVFLVFLPRCRRLILFWGFSQLASSKSDSAIFTFGSNVAMLFALVLSVVLMLGVHVGHTNTKREEELINKPVRRRASRYVFVTLLTTAIILMLIFKVITLASSLSIVFATLTISYQITDFLLIFSKHYSRASWFAVVRTVHKTFSYAVGLILFAPVLVISFLPWFAELQARCLWNIDFSTRLDTAKVFARQQQRKY